MKCGGIHCGGCPGHSSYSSHGEHGGGAGGGGGLATVALAVLIIGAAIETHAHQIVRWIEITGYVLASIAAAGAVAAITYGVLRARRRVLAVRARRIPPRVRAVITDARPGRPVTGEITSGRRGADAVVWLPGELPGGSADGGDIEPALLAEIERLIRMSRKGRDQ
jgi:hypothetical protein